jgi:hypothetical protein
MTGLLILLFFSLSFTEECIVEYFQTKIDQFSVPIVYFTLGEVQYCANLVDYANSSKNASHFIDSYNYKLECWKCDHSKMRVLSITVSLVSNMAQIAVVLTGVLGVLVVIMALTTNLKNN